MPPSLSSRAVKLANLVLRSDAPFDNTNSDPSYPDTSRPAALSSGPSTSTSAATSDSAFAKEFDQTRTFVHAWMVVVPVVIGLVVLGIAICYCVACARKSHRPPVVPSKRNHIYGGIEPQGQVVGRPGPVHGLKLPSKGLEEQPDDRQPVEVDLSGKELPPQPRSEDALPPPEYQASNGGGRPSAARGGPSWT